MCCIFMVKNLIKYISWQVGLVCLTDRIIIIDFPSAIMAILKLSAKKKKTQSELTQQNTPAYTHMKTKPI